jgi:RHS repeat-associated protein
MRRFYLLPALLFLGSLVLNAQVGHADCVPDTSPGQANVSSPYYNVKFGTQIESFAGSDPDECEDYVTDIDGWSANVLTGIASDSEPTKSNTNQTIGIYTVNVNANAYSDAAMSRASVLSSVYAYGQGHGAASSGSSDLVDLLLVENLSVGTWDVKNIPIEFCSQLQSNYSSIGSNKSALSYNDFSYFGHKAYDGLIWDSGSSGSVIHSANNQVCNSGVIQMTGKYVYFYLKLSTSSIGNLGQEDIPGSGGTAQVNVRDAKMASHVKLLSLPENAVCYSASGSFAGCDRKIPEPLQCASSGGNPIDFATGVKHQTESDFNGGLLSLSRFYRSDAEDLSGTFGEMWRHNFDRKANILVNTETTTVDVRNADQSLTVFKKDSGGDWNPLDVQTTSTFEDVFDSTPTHIGYLYTTENDTKEHYDLDGLLTRIEYRGGEALDLEYDGSDRLDTVTNQNGKTLDFTYNGSDQITSIVTPTGTFSYTYDGNDNLATVTRPDSEVRTYHYEDTNFVNALTGITDEENVRFATFAYDSEGRATSSEHAGGVDDFDVAYNADGTVTTTNALGKDTIYTFLAINGVKHVVKVDGQASTNCVAASRSNNYDDRGFLESKTDWKGNVTDYERDSNGLVTSMTEDVDGSAERTTTTTYDSTYRLPDVITETGKTTDYDYDSDGRVTSMTVTDTGTSEARTTTYTYYTNTTDANGNTVLGKLHKVNGPRTDVTDETTYTYDANDRLIKVSNALGHETETTSFDSANRPLKVEDANNVETTFVYDSLGRVTSSTVASGTALAATTSYTYDDNGNVLTITLPNGVVTTNTYDNARRLTGVEDDIGNTITYTYDDAGNITKEEYKNTSSTLKYTMSKVYDELSRIIESVDANTESTEFEYDVNGNQTKVIDGNTNETDFAFDGLNRLVETTDALSGTTSYDLNDLNQNEGTTDPRSNETTYSYNAFGDITQEVSPDRGTISYSHDKAGNVTQMTDARSVVTDYSYDAINRLTDIEYPSDSSLDVELTYDSATGCGTSKGHLCKVDDASGVTDYVYDDLGRLTKVTETRGALSFVTEYEYDLAGVLTEITLPSGRTIDYTLNDNGQVSAVSADINAVSTSLASSITYLPFGPVSSMTYGNSITLSNTHNTAYQLTNRTIGTLMNENFTYDDANNITAKGADSYTLDDLYRITAENSDSYTYDAIGNRLTKNTDDYTYPSTSSKLNDVEGDAVLYDSAGNITDDTARDYVIDAANRLESIEISSSTVGEYVYNASNQRTSKTVSSVTTHYVYGQGGLLYGEYDNSGNLIREYVYLNGEPIAQIDDVSSSDVVTYLHTDHLGTPRYGTNSGGTQVWAWDSDAFGIGTPTGSVTVNLRFPGQYFDAESDLHYNWNRYYNPETGRYIASDPIGLDGGLNTYLYANANPVMFIDPNGELAIPLAYVVWGGAIITVSACNVSPQCRDGIVNGTIAVYNTINDAAKALGQIIEDVVDYCTGDDGDMSCEKRYELDINFCDIQYEKILFVLGEDEARLYYKSCAEIAGDRLSNCKRGIMDTPKMPGSIF